MKKVIIIGAGISGMTAGIYLQKAGYQTEIYEKNPLPGGQCTGWKREGYFIDNCIHWLTGTKPGSDLYQVWNEIGALGENVQLHEKDMFYRVEKDGETLTWWRDLERTRKELIELSPQDKEEIHKLIDHVKLAESMQIPVKKPFDMMNPLEFMKLGMSMADMSKVLKEYGKDDIKSLGERFHHPLIRFALKAYMPSENYYAQAFFVSYATVTAGNGDVPKGGSLAMSLRIAEKYKSLGGVLHTKAEVEKILLSDKSAEGILLKSGEKKDADYVICACDTGFTFSKLLDASYMPKALKEKYIRADKHPVMTAFQVAFGVEEKPGRLCGTQIFACEPLIVGNGIAEYMSAGAYDYEPEFAPEGCFVVQSNFVQNEMDYQYWMELSKDRDAYLAKKQELAEEVLERLLVQYPEFVGKVKILDVWTPATYDRWCHSYKGAYMGFISTKGAKSGMIPGKIKGLSNVLIASQWLMDPGGLPVAAAMGKFAAQRIMKDCRK